MKHHADGPRAGYFKMPMVRRGAMVAVRIWLDTDRRDPDFPDLPLDRSPIWRAELDGVEVEVARVWPWCDRNRIDAGEFRYLLADASHARQHRPGSPEANPERAADIESMAPIF